MVRDVGLEMSLRTHAAAFLPLACKGIRRTNGAEAMAEHLKLLHILVRRSAIRVDPVMNRSHRVTLPRHLIVPPRIEPRSANPDHDSTPSLTDLQVPPCGDPAAV